jgi:S-formylglutathione hydrolase FrmB
VRRAAALAGLAVLAAGCGAGVHPSGGATVLHYRLHSRLAHRDMEQTLVLPAGAPRGRPLLVLLHGRGGDGRDFLSPQLFAELARLGRRAPVVLIPSGGTASYFHDRRDGSWGSYVIREAIPAARRRAHASRLTAIGGISMGGFGAFDLARLYPLGFCAVGGHAPAMWFRGADTPQGSFDDAEDFARHDVIGAAASGNPYGRMPVWIDVGRDDPFLRTDTALAHDLSAHGAHVTFWVHGGGHGGWGARMARYLRFYAGSLAHCSR